MFTNDFLKRNHLWRGDRRHNRMPMMIQYDLHAIYAQAQSKNNSTKHCIFHKLLFAYIRKPKNHEVHI